MARKLERGDRVKILDLPGTMPEFIGAVGRVAGTEKYGETFYRVMLDSPVYVEGIGRVRDDLWTRRFLRKVR